MNGLLLPELFLNYLWWWGSLNFSIFLMPNLWITGGSEKMAWIGMKYNLFFHFLYFCQFFLIMPILGILEGDWKNLARIAIHGIGPRKISCESFEGIWVEIIYTWKWYKKKRKNRENVGGVQELSHYLHQKVKMFYAMSINAISQYLHIFCKY